MNETNETPPAETVPETIPEAPKFETIKVQFGDGFVYWQPVGKAKKKRLERTLTRLKNGNSFEAALIGMGAAHVPQDRL